MALSKEQTAIAEALFADGYAVTVGKRTGNGVSREIPMAKMPLAAWRKIVGYGVQRTFNDAIGGSDTTQDEKLATVEKMIEAYLAGDIGRARAAGVDPLTAEIRIVMRQLVKAEMEAEAYKAVANADDFDETLDAIFADQTEADQKAITAAAQVALDAKAEARKAKAGLKLGGLGKLAK